MTSSGKGHLQAVLKRLHFPVAPDDVVGVQRKNFLHVQIDAVAVGLANAANPFLPVFLTRLGATNNQIGLLTAMPGVTGLLLALPVGRFLQRQRQIVPWFGVSRLMVISSYALTGLVVFLVPPGYQVTAVLLIWALASLPQTALAVCFSVVMNAVAGPEHRYELMSRRWSILGITTAITAVLAGQVLVRFNFPINYQVVFIALSVGGLLSYYYSSHIVLPDAVPPEDHPGQSITKRMFGFASLIWSQRNFVRFSTKRYVFLFGTLLATPILPLYYVKVVDASDAWIGIISTSQTAVLVIGYSIWTRTYRSRGSRFVLLCTTLGLSLYPALLALTHAEVVVAMLAGVAGIFQAGLDLVFFDELMRTVPDEYSATFVSFSQSLVYSAAILAPLLGTQLSNTIGLGGVLVVSAGIRGIGFLLFLHK
jgi:hypothetical protein